jgi:integrase
MPLKLIPPRKSPNWSIRGTYLGRYIDRSSGSGKRAVAAKVLKGIERQIERGAYAEPGEATFASAAASYMKAGGERTYLRKLLEHFGDKPLREIDQAEIDAAAIALYPNASCGHSQPTGLHADLGCPRHAGIQPDLGGPRQRRQQSKPRGSGPSKPKRSLKKRTSSTRRSPRSASRSATRAEAERGARADVERCEAGRWIRLHTRHEERRASSCFSPPVAVAALGVYNEWRDESLSIRKIRPSLFASPGAAFRAGVDLPERSAFHIFRHTYMTWMRRYAGLDELGLLALGTHKDRKSVGRYTHTVVSEEARRAGVAAGWENPWSWLHEQR